MSRIADHLAALTDFRDRDALDATLASALRDLLRPESVAIHRCVGDGDERRWLTRARLAGTETTVSADPAWGDPALLPRLAERPDRLACLQRGTPRMVGPGPTTTLFPLTTERGAAGVLELRTARPPDDEALRLVGSILRVYRNFNGLLDDSEHDPLTGLLNRQTFDATFLRTAFVDADRPGPDRPAAPAPGAGARRDSGGPCWLAVVDIDHFKRVNDGHGHLIGDEVLLLLAQLMRASFRFHDRLYRFGGEEFVVLMRCGGAAEAAAAFERLRATVREHVFPRVGRITVSIGFTRVRPGDSPSAAFDRADQAVYHAKQSGRDRVADHARLVAGGVLEDAERVGDMVLF